MPLHGQLKRSKPRLEVLRGYNPNEPHTLTQSLPVKSGVTIQSGQIIYPVWNATTAQYEWNLGCAAGKIPYFALQDWDNSQTVGLGQFGYDPDVQEAGKLTGLSCAGEFELQTAFYASEGTYAMDTKLTYVLNTDTTPGVNGVAGDVTVAGSGDYVIGFISRPTGENSVNDLSGVNSNVTTKTVVTLTTNYSGTPLA